MAKIVIKRMLLNLYYIIKENQTDKEIKKQYCIKDSLKNFWEENFKIF